MTALNSQHLPDIERYDGQELHDHDGVSEPCVNEQQRAYLHIVALDMGRFARQAGQNHAPCLETLGPESPVPAIEGMDHGNQAVYVQSSAGYGLLSRKDRSLVTGEALERRTRSDLE